MDIHCHLFNCFNCVQCEEIDVDLERADRSYGFYDYSNTDNRNALRDMARVFVYNGYPEREYVQGMLGL